MARASRWWLYLQEQKVVLVAAAAAVALLATGRVDPRRIPGAVDWELLLLLFALILAVELLRESNVLERAAALWMSRFRNARTFTLASALFAGALAALVTNDVALFVVVPVTVAAARSSQLDGARAIMLQIVAVNLVGCLTPLGNPQNLFIAHQSGWNAATFIAAMAPFVLWSAAGIAIAVPLLEPRRAVEAALTAPPLRAAPFVAGSLVFAIVVLEIFGVVPAWPAAAAAAIGTLLLLRARIGEIDIFIIPLFFFAFIVVEGLRSFDVYALFALLPREPDGLSLWVTTLLTSQIISNVPAAVLLEPLAGERWRLLLYAVNAGGCGTMIASMANLIGWRLYARECGNDPRFFNTFSLVQVAFLAWSGIGGWFLV
jgi:Na+/H+ antiporter NhaD/arsenite permease-like protein